jgi:hypothetical protein
MPKTIYSEREKRLIRACEIVNAGPEVRQIEAEFDALLDEIAEPWNDRRQPKNS